MQKSAWLVRGDKHTAQSVLREGEVVSDLKDAPMGREVPCQPFGSLDAKLAQARHAGPLCR